MQEDDLNDLFKKLSGRSKLKDTPEMTAEMPDQLKELLGKIMGDDEHSPVKILLHAMKMSHICTLLMPSVQKWDEKDLQLICRIASYHIGDPDDSRTTMIGCFMACAHRELEERGLKAEPDHTEEIHELLDKMNSIVEAVIKDTK